jgi:hypothetical protein
MTDAKMTDAKMTDAKKAERERFRNEHRSQQPSNILVCELFRNIIIEQNKSFLKTISIKHNIEYESLIQKYLKPEYYLPVIVKETI